MVEYVVIVVLWRDDEEFVVYVLVDRVNVSDD